MSITLRRFGALSLSIILAAGCAQDHISAPTPATRAAAPAGLSHSLLGSVVGGVTSALGLTEVNGLLRTTPLASDISVSRTVGAEGGTLGIPAAGVTVVIPAGALASNTVITMTARKGILAAYDFAPHGITFAQPLVFTQKLAGTNASLLSAPFLRLGYYTDPSLLGTTTGLVSELLSGVTNLLSWSFTAPISHFSGYMVSCNSGD